MFSRTNIIVFVSLILLLSVGVYHSSSSLDYVNVIEIPILCLMFVVLWVRSTKNIGQKIKNSQSSRPSSVSTLQKEQDNHFNLVDFLINLFTLGLF